MAEISIQVCNHSETATCYYQLDHIKTIDNIYCIATISLKYNTNAKCYHFTFRIRPLEICNPSLELWNYYYYFKHVIKNVNDLAKELQNVYSLLSTLKFDRYSGSFKDPKHLELIQNVRTTFSMKNHPSITTRIDNCAICHEPTMTHTRCKHYICVSCADESIINSYKDCPICRSIDELDVIYGIPSHIPGTSY